MVGFDTRRETFLELVGEGAGGFVARAGLGRHDDLADVAYVDLVDSGEGRLGVVAPLGGPKSGQEALADRLQDLGRDLGLRSSPSAHVLLLDPLAEPRHPVAQHQARQRLLDLGKIAQYCIPMRSAGSKALGPGARRGGWTLAAVLVGAAGTILTPLGPIVATAGSAAPVIAPATLAISGATAAGASWATIGSASLAGELGRHAPFVASCTQDLQRLGHRPFLLGRQHGRDDDPVDAELGFGSDHVADRRTVVEQPSVELAAGLSGPGGTPGVRAVISFARELDLEPS